MVIAIIFWLKGWWSGGYTYGLWIGILVASGFSVVPVSSRSWKDHFELFGSSSSKVRYFVIFFLLHLYIFFQWRKLAEPGLLITFCLAHQRSCFLDFFSTFSLFSEGIFLTTSYLWGKLIACYTWGQRIFQLALIIFEFWCLNVGNSSFISRNILDYHVVWYDLSCGQNLGYQW